MIHKEANWLQKLIVGTWIISLTYMGITFLISGIYEANLILERLLQ